MKYQPQNLRFSLEQRRMLNEKVLYLIDSHSCAQYDINTTNTASRKKYLKAGSFLPLPNSASW